MTWLPMQRARKHERVPRHHQRARFLLDENMDVALVSRIVDTGHKGLLIRDEGLSGHDDGRVFRHARDEDLVLLTMDGDFRRGFDIQKSPGVFIFSDGGPIEVGNAVAHVAALVGPQRDAWRATEVRVSDPHTWIVRSWIPDRGREVLLGLRFECDGSRYEIEPRGSTTAADLEGLFTFHE